MTDMTSTVATDPAAIDKPRTARRLPDIERGKGLGILLVVYGHLVMFGTYGEQAWYAASKDAVYLFHMPLFMYLSGYVFTYSRAAEKARDAYGQFVARRADRLLVPFFAFALLIVGGKYLAGQVLDVDQNVEGFWVGVQSVFLNTENSPALSIWYMYVLFFYSVLTPLFIWLTRGRWWPILALALVLYFIPATTDFYLFRICHFFIFFVAGCFIAQHRDVVLPWFDRLLWPALVVFALTLLLERSWYPSLLICGFASIVAIHALLRQKFMDQDRFLLFIGQNSMVIYLLNTIVIGVVKPLYARVLPVDGFNFVIFVFVVFLAGVFIPILIKQVLVRSGLVPSVVKYFEG